MTAQAPDNVFYKGEEFYLAGVDGSPLMTPEFLGYKRYGELDVPAPIDSMEVESSNWPNPNIPTTSHKVTG